MDLSRERDEEDQLEIHRDRCFIGPVLVPKVGTGYHHGLRPGPRWEEIIPQIIHVPGLRGNPKRTYSVTGVGPTYSGTFEEYTASLISRWADESEPMLRELSNDLKLLGLTSGVLAVRLNDAEIELYVGRLPDVLPSRLEDE